jgi:hypothetical protein
MLTKDFYGKNGFIWWVGQVEDNEDPLKLGSVRVRIIGVHSENKSLVPTESLPWAQIMLPANGSDLVVAPRISDWVFGFFQDGEYAQIPVVMGIFPGIESVQSQTLYNEIVTSKGGPTNFPETTQIDRETGEPITPRIARGVLEGTLVNATNQLRSHACDITPQVKHAASYIKAQFGVVVEAIRKAVRAILALMGLGDPNGFSTFLTQTAKEISRLLTMVQKVLDEITTLTDLLVGIANAVGAVISYINSLPDKLLKFFRDCLSRLEAIKDIVADIFAAPLGGGDLFSGFAEFGRTINQISSQLNGVKNSLVRIAATPARMVEGIVNPGGSTDPLGLERQIKGTLNSIITTGTTVVNRNMVSANTVGQPI